MYQPGHFQEHRTEALHVLMHEHPLGMLVTHASGSLDADHLPFLLDADRGPLGTLVGHVARANPVWQHNPTGSPVMVVFRGAQAYVSPNGYPSKREHHRQVPTWNYEVVHAHGKLRVVDDERFVRAVVARLTRRHEAGEPVPWKMGDAPRDDLDAMVKQVVGVEIEIMRLEGKRKLSQNKDERDRDGVLANLRARGEHAAAAAMADAFKG